MRMDYVEMRAQRPYFWILEIIFSTAFEDCPSETKTSVCQMKILLSFTLNNYLEDIFSEHVDFFMIHKNGPSVKTIGPISTLKFYTFSK